MPNKSIKMCQIFLDFGYTMSIRASINKSFQTQIVKKQVLVKSCKQQFSIGGNNKNGDQYFQRVVWRYLTR